MRADRAVNAPDDEQAVRAVRGVADRAVNAPDDEQAVRAVRGVADRAVSAPDERAVRGVACVPARAEAGGSLCSIATRAEPSC